MLIEIDLDMDPELALSTVRQALFLYEHHGARQEVRIHCRPIWNALRLVRPIVRRRSVLDAVHTQYVADKERADG